MWLEVVTLEFHLSTVQPGEKFRMGSYALLATTVQPAKCLYATISKSNDETLPSNYFVNLLVGCKEGRSSISISYCRSQPANRRNVWCFRPLKLFSPPAGKKMQCEVFPLVSDVCLILFRPERKNIKNVLRFIFHL